MSACYNTKYKHNFVYIIINKLNNKKYIGCKSCNEEPYNVIGKTYFSCSKNKNFMKEQYNNPENFKYIVLKDFNTRKEALNFECKLHERYKVNINENFYNIAKQTSSGFDVHIKHEHWSEEVKRKISLHNMGKKISQETINKTIETKRKNGTMPIGEKNPMYGRHHSAETLKKISENCGNKKEKHPLWGKHHSEETKKKISLAHKGKCYMSLENKEKIIKNNTGSKWLSNDELKISHKVKKENIEKYLNLGYYFGRNYGGRKHNQS